MRNKDQLAPTGGRLGCVDHEPVGDGKNRIAKIGVHAADAIEIIAGMVPAAFLIHLPKFLRVVDQRPVLGAERQIEAHRTRNRGSLPCRERVASEIRLATRWHF